MLIDLRSWQTPGGWEDPARLPVPIVTCDEMKRLEKAADEAGLSYLEMMENAGMAAARLVCQAVSGDLDRRGHAHSEAGIRAGGVGSAGAGIRAGGIDSAGAGIQAGGIGPAPVADCFEAELPRVLALCGKGNNGGDGYVAARHLAGAGFAAAILQVGGQASTPDARENFRRLPSGITSLTKDTLETYLAEGGPLVIIDAVYGTGFKGRLEGDAALIVRRINSHLDFHRDCALTFCLDLPSGLPGDLAQGTPDFCLHGDYTLAFHGLKPIHLNPEALPFMGGLIVADIGIGQVLAGS